MQCRGDTIPCCRRGRIRPFFLVVDSVSTGYLQSNESAQDKRPTECYLPAADTRCHSRIFLSALQSVCSNRRAAVEPAADDICRMSAAYTPSPICQNRACAVLIASACEKVHIRTFPAMALQRPAFGNARMHALSLQPRATLECQCIMGWQPVIQDPLPRCRYRYKYEHVKIQRKYFCPNQKSLFASKTCTYRAIRSISILKRKSIDQRRRSETAIADSRHKE